MSLVDLSRHIEKVHVRARPAPDAPATGVRVGGGTFVSPAGARIRARGHNSRGKPGAYALLASSCTTDDLVLMSWS